MLTRQCHDHFTIYTDIESLCHPPEINICQLYLNNLKKKLYLVITYCVSGTVLGPWDTAVNKTNRIPTVMDLRAVGKTDNTQTDK